MAKYLEPIPFQSPEGCKRWQTEDGMDYACIDGMCTINPDAKCCLLCPDFGACPSENICDELRVD
jgi:hypothetical protein